MDHGANEIQKEDAATVVRNQRLGLKLFAGYAITYFLFIVCCMTSPGLLQATPLWGISNSVVFGFGLIFLAIAIALIYGLACRGTGGVSSQSVLGTEPDATSESHS